MQSASDEHWKSPDCTTIITAFCSLGHFLTHIDNSFIHSGYLYSSPSRHLLRGALSLASLRPKRNVLAKKLAEGRHVVPGQQAQRKREFIPSGGANHRESLTLFNNTY